MRILEKFENAIGLRAYELDEDQLIKIIENEKYHQFFNTPNKVIELFSEMIEATENESFKKELKTIKFSMQFIEDKSLVLTKFDEEKNDIETKVLSFIRSEDPFFALMSVSCGMEILSVNFSEFQDLIKENIKRMKEIFEEISENVSSYELRCNMIDLLNNISTQFFDKYDIDLSDDLKWLSEKEEKISDIEKDLYVKMLHDESFLKDIIPEDLGLIDATKLKGDAIE